MSHPTDRNRPPPPATSGPAGTGCRCPSCDYDVSSLPTLGGSVSCPECGTCAPPSLPPQRLWRWTLADLLWSTGPGTGLLLGGMACEYLRFVPAGLILQFCALLTAIIAPAFVVDFRRRARTQGRGWALFLLGSWFLSAVLFVVNRLVFQILITL